MYYKLATFIPRAYTFLDGKIAYDTEEEAVNAAHSNGGGTYRVSTVAADGTRTDLAPFTVEGPVREPKKPAVRSGGPCRRPTPYKGH